MEEARSSKTLQALKGCFCFLFASACTIAPLKAQVIDLEISVAEKECRTAYPDWSDFFERRNCIANATKAIRKRVEDVKKQEAAKKREIDARECISNDLERMEASYIQIYDTLKKEFVVAISERNAENIQSGQIENALKAIGTFVEKVSSSDNIREKVLVASVNTKCPSDFHFLINIRLDQNSNVKWFRGWSQTPPTGYQDSIINSRSYLSYVAMQEDDRAKKAEAKKKADEVARLAEEQRAETERINKAYAELLNKLASPDSPGFTVDPNGCRFWNEHPKEGEKVSWDGPCVDGLAQGFGTTRWTFLEGGQLKVHVFTGNFSKGSISDGPFEIIFENGSKMKGSLRNRKYEGRNQVWSKANKLLTDLNFEDGKKVGWGLITFNDNTKYEGYFANDLVHGKGTMYRADGSISYQGEFKNGKRDGFGKLFVQDHRYEGYFKDGLANGGGIWFMPDKSGQITQIKIKAKNDCLWRDMSTYFHTLSTDEAKCKIDGYPY